MKGIRVHFNKKNTYEEPCCCEKGYYTKFGASTVFCILCNLTRARTKKKVNSFCKKNNWDKTCRTCNQCGEYHLLENDKYKKDLFDKDINKDKK